MVTDTQSLNDDIILATGGYDHTIKIWQTHTGICLRTMQHQESVSTIILDNIVQGGFHYCNLIFARYIKEIKKF